MSTATLTEDQRWLLYAGPRNLIPVALIDPDYGISRLRESHAGGAWPPGRALIPEWLRSYQVVTGGIEGGELGEPSRVKVTWGQLKQFAQALPVELRAVLMDARKADRNNCDTAMLTVLGLDENSPRQLDMFEAI